MKTIEIKCEGAGLASLDDLIIIQGKFKTLSPKAAQKLRTSILKEGFADPIRIWISGKNKKFNIIDGTQRITVLRQMRSEGYEVPALPVDYIQAKTRAEAIRKIIALSSQFGDINIVGLEELMAEGKIKFTDIDEFAKLLHGGKEIRLQDLATTETENDDKIPEEVAPITKTGDVWEMGEHRLLCGDATSEKDVEIATRGVAADMMFADPPYGVDYAGKNEFLNKQDKGNHIQTPIKNDAIKDYEKFYTAFLQQTRLGEYGAFYIMMSGHKLYELLTSLKSENYKTSQILVWAKNNHVLGRQDYFNKHEFVIYGWQKKHKYYGKKDVSVWEIDKPHKSELHPTMKPIELITRAIINSTKKEHIVYDPFLGAGSATIACEKTGRVCYGIEIDPHYCDVTVKRYIEWMKANNRKSIIKLNGNTFAIKNLI